jgi:hypothetical protein
MTVIGILTVVSSTLISWASTYCNIKADAKVSTIGLKIYVNTSPSFLGYDCGAGAGIGDMVVAGGAGMGLAIPVGGTVVAPAPCVKSILAACCPPDKG